VAGRGAALQVVAGPALGTLPADGRVVARAGARGRLANVVAGAACSVPAVGDVRRRRWRLPPRSLHSRHARTSSTAWWVAGTGRDLGRLLRRRHFHGREAGAGAALTGRPRSAAPGPPVVERHGRERPRQTQPWWLRLPWTPVAPRHSGPVVRRRGRFQRA